MGNTFQFGEELLAHFIAGRASRMGRQIDRTDRLSRTIHDRYGQRTKPAFKLLIDDGELLFMIGADPVVQRLQIGDGLRSASLDALRFQPPPDFGIVEKSEQDSS